MTYESLQGVIAERYLRRNQLLALHTSPQEEASDCIKHPLYRVITDGVGVYKWNRSINGFESVHIKLWATTVIWKMSYQYCSKAPISTSPNPQNLQWWLSGLKASLKIRVKSPEPGLSRSMMETTGPTKYTQHTMVHPPHNKNTININKTMKDVVKNLFFLFMCMCGLLLL